MSSLLTIDLADVRANLAFRRLINRTPIDQITWTDGGAPVSVDPDQIERWHFTGMNHIDFAEIVLIDGNPLVDLPIPPSSTI